MKLIIPLLALVLFSCNAEKRAQRRCAKCPIKTEIKDSIVYRHDTVQIQLPGKPGPVQYLENPCHELCDSLSRLKHINITTTRNGQVLNIKTVGNSLAISSETKDTTAKVPVQVKDTYHSEHIEKPIYIPCTNERTAWDGFCRWFTYIVMAAAGIYFGVKLIRKKLTGK